MQAIILAAGMGKRLRFLTENNTKCMVEVNGVSLIDRMLHQIEKHDFNRIVIVTGYKSQVLIDYINTLNISTEIIYIDNPIYDKTNNIYSLYLAKDFLCEDDTILFESDLIFEDAILDALIEDPRDSLCLVDKYKSWMDGTCVKLSSNDEIAAFVPGKHFNYKEKDEYYKTVNIYKFSKTFSTTHYVPFLEAYQSALGENEYYEQVLKVITMLDNPGIKARRLTGQKWYEIDDIQDLDIAESIFITDEDERVQLLQGRYGGYWRYPDLLDYCYLVNPYFPPQRMIDEMTASFKTLLTQYPSGMKINSLLAAKNMHVKPENIVVGNGAAELIKGIMDKFTGKIGIIRPTFEEYANRYTGGEIVEFWPQNPGFTYDSKDLIEHFEGTGISYLILINPDNPSGNYLNKAEITNIVTWTKENNIKLVLDESFSDFSDEKNNTFINDIFLRENPHVYVVKSISKSYGVPGLRLGVLASGDTKMIDYLKQDMSIWNINSFAEFYMQIEEKYRHDYESALVKFRRERTHFIKKLSDIDYLEVFPTQSNFVMAKITNGMGASELTRKLIINDNILIKNLYPKVKGLKGHYIRLAIKTREENNRVVEALQNISTK